jgi:hypothetical protein
VTAQTPPIHRRLAEIGLRAGGPFGFALAGGHAVAAHGILVLPDSPCARGNGVCRWNAQSAR